MQDHSSGFTVDAVVGFIGFIGFTGYMSWVKKGSKGLTGCIGLNRFAGFMALMGFRVSAKSCGLIVCGHA